MIALRRIRRAQATLVRSEAAAMSRLRTARAHIRAGYASFTDFTREVLQMSPRTGKRRLALHRAFVESPALARAFEETRLSTCQVLALRPLGSEPGLPLWIEFAETASVRELTRRVRQTVAEARGEPADAVTGDLPPDEEPGRRVTFAAPLTAAIAWDRGLETARRVLGFDAPAHACIQAILDECASELAELEAHDGNERDSDPGQFGSGPLPPTLAPGPRSAAPPSRKTPGTPRHTSPARAPLGPVQPHRAGVTALRTTLALADSELHRLEPKLHTVPPESPDQLIPHLRRLKRVDRPLRILLGRLLRDLQASRALYAIGYDSLPDFAESALKLSPRTAQRLIAQAFLFDDHPDLTQAFRDGRIGAGQAFLVRRVALQKTRRAYLRRAEQVPHVALEREVRFLERLGEVAPSIAREFRGPFPLPGLEDALLDAMAKRGWAREAVLACLRDRGLEDPASALLPASSGNGQPEPSPKEPATNDPTRNPLILRRLEVLLELLVAANAEYDARITDGKGPVPASDGAPPSEPPTALTEVAAAPLPTLAPTGRMTTISFWAPESLIDTWFSALAAIRKRWGPLPAWAAATLLLEHALRTWDRADPRRRPSEHRILERDDYRCQVPGCSARRRLEVHHIVFRSQGGSDAPGNKITLCQTHHQHGIHEGWVTVRGEAPGGLRWGLHQPHLNN